MSSVSLRNCIRHCNISKTIIKNESKMLILPHIPKDSTSQPKELKFASGILSAFEQIKQNSLSDPLFSIPSTKQRSKWVILGVHCCVVFYNSIAIFTTLMCSVESILMCLFKNRLVYIKYRLKKSKINPHLNLELILHTRLFQRG